MPDQQHQGDELDDLDERVGHVQELVSFFGGVVFSRAHTRFWYIKSEKRPKEGGWDLGKGGGAKKWRDIVSMAMKRL